MMNVTTMTKLEIRETLATSFGVEMSNTTFKSTKVAELRIMLESELSKVQTPEVKELVIEKEIEVEVEITDGSFIPTPEQPKTVVAPVVIPEEKKEPVAPKKATPMYFQHIRTHAVYRWVKNITIGKTEVVVFTTPQHKEHKVTREIAKKMYRKVSVDFVKQLIATDKNKKAARTQGSRNLSNAPTCEVNVNVVNGQRHYTVKGLKTGRVVKAREGKSLANLINGYEVQVKELKAKVTFVPVTPIEDTKTPVAPF